MPSYDDHQFSPPAPMAKVTLRHPENETMATEASLLIDTGADVTLIPQSAIDLLEIEASSDEAYELVGLDGSMSLARAVRLDLIFLRRIFKGRYLIIEQEYGILGRDILNHLSLIFDGPQLFWEEKR